MKTLGIFSLLLLGCTASQGAITGDVLTGICDAGSIALGAPGAIAICADINTIEQLIANRNATAGASAAAPMSQTDLYMMVKASGRFTPARVK